ncbi:unnamed protein product [Withania somnifera]
MEKFGKRFKGKVAIVTPSTQGIGFSIAERLGLEGASLVISSRKQKYGKLDVIVSNTAVNPTVDAILETKEPALDKLWDINAKAAILLFQALAAEMAPSTRVNCVSPGFVPTHFANFITGNANLRKELEAKTLLNRLGTTQDMAAATAYLASDDAAYVTGETLVVAGGMHFRL